MHAISFFFCHARNAEIRGMMAAWLYSSRWSQTASFLEMHSREAEQAATTAMTKASRMADATRSRLQ